MLAGGGTAGHTSPLIATGLELRRLSPGLALIALGTPRGLETTVVPAAGLELELIPRYRCRDELEQIYCFSDPACFRRCTPP